MRDGDSAEHGQVGDNGTSSASEGDLVGEWYHSREESEAGHKVYRPASYDFPLTRQPRDVVRLDGDGTASIGAPNAADRTDRRAARWQLADGAVSVVDGSSTITFRVDQTSAGEIVLTTTTGKGHSDAHEED